MLKFKTKHEAKSNKSRWIGVYFGPNYVSRIRIRRGRYLQAWKQAIRHGVGRQLLAAGFVDPIARCAMVSMITDQIFTGMSR